MNLGMKLREQLQDEIPREKLNYISNSFDVIGDIAVVSIPPDIEDYKEQIAKTILLTHRNIVCVLNKISKLEGEERVGGFEVLAGGGTVTLHREFGYRYRLDVSKVFFTPRLAFERNRITTMVRSGEKVIIPFCGVGPFAIPIASAGSRVVAVEKNSEACGWLSENARLNRVFDNITLIRGDASTIIPLLKPDFDRAIVPTPYGMDQILDIVSPVVKKGGKINFYTFKKGLQIDGLIKKFNARDFTVEFYRSCGNVAPGVSRWVFDLAKS
jgi:tRNA (guanine37-N1)-methyltransferase